MEGEGNLDFRKDFGLDKGYLRKDFLHMGFLHKDSLHTDFHRDFLHSLDCHRDWEVVVGVVAVVYIK